MTGEADNENLLLEDELANLFMAAVPQDDFSPKDEFRVKNKNKNKKSKKYTQDDLFAEQVLEQKQRRHFRCLMFWLFFLLLLGQHMLLIWFVCYLAGNEIIKEAQPILAVVIPSTLGETYAIINVMVKFIFSPGNFEYKITSTRKE